jgi:hypothetical protein
VGLPTNIKRRSRLEGLGSVGSVYHEGYKGGRCIIIRSQRLVKLYYDTINSIDSRQTDFLAKLG